MPATFCGSSDVTSRAESSQAWLSSTDLISVSALYVSLLISAFSSSSSTRVSFDLPLVDRAGAESAVGGDAGVGAGGGVLGAAAAGAAASTGAGTAATANSLASGAVGCGSVVTGGGGVWA